MSHIVQAHSIRISLLILSMDDLQEPREAMPKVKFHHGAVLNPGQLVKQVANGFLQFEVISAGENCSFILATEARDSHHSRMLI